VATVYARIESRIARQPFVKAAVRAERDKVADIAKGLFAEHDNPGGHKITTTNSRKTDAFINMDGPAPLSVEFGHFAAQSADGDIPRFVEGLHIFSRAIAAAQL
jgi:hypothetical protein